MATSTRIYAAKNKDGSVRLVRASSQSQTYRHLARSTWDAEVASQDVLVEALSGGAKVEEAKDDE